MATTTIGALLTRAERQGYEVRDNSRAWDPTDLRGELQAVDLAAEVYVSKARDGRLLAHGIDEAGVVKTGEALYTLVRVRRRAERGSLGASVLLEMSPALMDQVKGAAEREGISVAAWVRRACEAAVLRVAAKRR